MKQRIHQVWMVVFMAVMAAFLAVPVLATDLSQMQTYGSDWKYPERAYPFSYIWKGDIGGENRKQITGTKNEWYPSLSTDGQWLVCHDKGNIVIKNLWKGTKRNLGPGQIGASMNANGTFVVFQRDEKLLLQQNKKGSVPVQIATVNTMLSFPRIGTYIVTYEEWVTLYQDPSTGEYREWDCEVEGPPCDPNTFVPFDQWGVMRITAIDIRTMESWVVDTSQPYVYDVWGHEVSPDDQFILNVRMYWDWENIQDTVYLYDVSDRTSDPIAEGSRALWVPDSSGFIFFNYPTGIQEYLSILDDHVEVVGSGWIMAEDIAFKRQRR